MEYLVHQGDSLDIVWPLPGVDDDPAGGITLDLATSFIELTFADGTVRRLEPIRDFAILRDVETKKIEAALSVKDTSAWPVGVIKYEARFLLKSGEVSNEDAGTIEVLEPNGEPQQNDVKPWDLAIPWEKVVDDEVKMQRLAICEGCDAYQGGRCTNCGCFMGLKATLARATCPLGLWGPDDGISRKERKSRRKQS